MLLYCFFTELNTYINVTSASSVQNFVVKADDLEQIAELGRGAYGVVDKMKHVPSGVIMAVKVGSESAAQVTWFSNSVHALWFQNSNCDLQMYLA